MQLLDTSRFPAPLSICPPNPASLYINAGYSSSKEAITCAVAGCLPSPMQSALFILTRSIWPDKEVQTS